LPYSEGPQQVDNAPLAPLVSETLRKQRRGRVGPSWYGDETYLKVKGRWTYLYRAILRSVPSKWWRHQG
jgi:hypothetical protein